MAELSKLSMKVPGKNETMVAQGDKLSTEIVERVAKITGATKTDLPVLYDTIDVEALTQVWHSADASLMVYFDYAGCELRLSGDGTLVVTEMDD